MTERDLTTKLDALRAKTAARGGSVLSPASENAHSLGSIFGVQQFQLEKEARQAPNTPLSAVVIPKPVQLRQADELLSGEPPTQDQWAVFQDRLRRSKGYREAVLLHPNADDKLKRHVRAMAKLHEGQHVRQVTSDTSQQRYQLKLMSSGRVGCTCPDWRYRKSHGGGDCKHVRRFKSALDAGQNPRGYKAMEKKSYMMKVASTRALREILRYSRGQRIPGLRGMARAQKWQEAGALKHFQRPGPTSVPPGATVGGRFSGVTPYQTREELLTAQGGGLGELGHRLSEEQAEGLFSRWANQTGIADRLQRAKDAGDTDTVRELSDRMHRAWLRVSPGGRTVRDLDSMMGQHGVRAVLGDDPVVAGGYRQELPRVQAAWKHYVGAKPEKLRETYPTERPRAAELLFAGMQRGDIPPVRFGRRNIRSEVVQKALPHYEELTAHWRQPLRRAHTPRRAVLGQLEAPVINPEGTTIPNLADTVPGLKRRTG